MMNEAASPTMATPGGQQQPITLIPVGLKEAALDSPAFRSGVTHFSEQLDIVERWLENYVRAIQKLSHEIVGFEGLINGFLAQSVTPTHLSEAILDHDYTLLAMKRYGDAAREFWTATIAALKKMESNLLEPIRKFLANDVRAFRETRKAFDHSQKNLDGILSRFSAQSRSKEASAVREDAFQVHEARKAYLKASMDFSVVAPQLRISLDKMLVKIFSDQWRDTRNTRQMGMLEKWTGDIERVRGWSQELEKGEKLFRQELQSARKEIEESAEAAMRPSRELEGYAVDSSAKSKGPAGPLLQLSGNNDRSARAERQGWLNLRTVSGKPSRTVWLRRWFYVKNGIFGWLVQGSKSGAVEESDRIGVLLCSVRPSNSDERRYVFEIKTKDTTITVQGETQAETNDWLAAFDMAKRRALSEPASKDSSGMASDPAFAISPPSAPEFAASAADIGMPHVGDEASSVVGVDRSTTLPVPGTDALATRPSFEVGTPKKANFDKEEGTREKFLSKLELHRKPLANGPGGIASLIAASHGSMPVGPGVPAATPEVFTTRRPQALLNLRDVPSSTLAPSTLAIPPVPTNLSSAAVVVNGERSITGGHADASGGIPSGLLANVWGSTNWGHLNRLERGESIPPEAQIGNTQTPGLSPSRPLEISRDLANKPNGSTPGNSPSHRHTVSLDQKPDLPASATPLQQEFPFDYPVQLRTQDAQFRLLFPEANRSDKLVLVFKASWNLTDQQEFPGRVYVTSNDIYFYSTYCGMTMTSVVPLEYFSEITAAGGRECDFLYLHLKDESPSGFVRISVKTFLEPLRLLQRRLSFLVQNSNDTINRVSSLSEIIKILTKFEHADDHGGRSSPSVDSWENVSVNTPLDDPSRIRRHASNREAKDLRTNVLIDRGLYNDKRDGNISRNDLNRSFKLPSQPVQFTPAGMDRLVVEREFPVSPKAMFHVLFGDKSAVWQLLYHERHAQHIRMYPWTRPDSGPIRRQFEYEIEYLDMFRQISRRKVSDHQSVDSAKEHLLYVVSDRKTPWHLPHRDDFTMLTKICITYVGKSKCKLALYTKVEWKRAHYSQKIIGRRALYDLKQDALDLVDVVADQCKKLGDHSRTKKATTVFGPVGVQTQILEFEGSDSPLAARLRRSTKPHSLASLIWESCASMTESVITSALQILFRIFAWMWNTISANGVILCILGFSIATNMVISSRNVTDSWRERRAAKYMARLGVGPDASMIKSVQLSDLAEASRANPILELMTGETAGVSSTCRTAFDQAMDLRPSTSAHNDSYSTPLASSFPASSSSTSSSQTTLQHNRLQRTRLTLGVQRHDLLVAMRVLNGIEREIVQAEWETWLMRESANCQRVGTWIQQKEKGGGENKVDGKAGGGDGTSDGHGPGERLEEIKTWYGDYCVSCIRARESLEV